MDGFDGFPKETFQFIADLRATNTKEWFEAHRRDYEDYYLEPAKQFIAAVARPLKRLSPEVNAEPRVGGSLFRINRDVRFSRDKRPYKDHLDFWFWEGDRKLAASGFFLRLQPKGIVIGAGAHAFDRTALARYRSAVVARGGDLLDAVTFAGTKGFAVHGRHYRRTPRGYEATPATESLLLHNSLWAGREETLFDAVYSPEFVGYCTSAWRRLLPVHRWLTDNLQG